MVKVTIEFDGGETKVLTGEYAWGAVSTKMDSKINTVAYLVGKINPSTLERDMASAISRIISNSVESKREEAAFLTRLLSDVMHETADGLKKEAVG